MRRARVVFGVVAALSIAAASCTNGPPVSTVPTPVGGTGSFTQGTPRPSAGRPVRGPCANQYVPVIKGASWTYYLSSNMSGSSSSKTSITALAHDSFTEKSRFAGATITTRWSCGRDGLVELEYGAGSPGSLTTSTARFTYTTSNVVGVTFPSKIAKGDTWRQSYDISGTTNVSGVTVTVSGRVAYDYRAGAKESVAVQAGTFRALIVTARVVTDLSTNAGVLHIPSKLHSTVTIWLVEGVGMVKTSTAGLINGAPIGTTTELTTYRLS
jgi:hypothetical protein